AGSAAPRHATPSAGFSQATSDGADSGRYRALLDQYCVSCHNERLRTANLVLEHSHVDLGRVNLSADIWEKVAQKLHTGAMPPAGRRHRTGMQLLSDLLPNVGTQIDPPEIDVTVLEDQVGRSQPFVMTGHAVLIQQGTVSTRIGTVRGGLREPRRGRCMPWGGRPR